MPESDTIRTFRREDGRLPHYALLGGYPYIYYTEDGLTVCPACADDDETSDPVIDVEVYWEGPPIACDDCGKMIESAYGDPESEDE